MLEAIFQEGILSLTLAGLTQWDYGQKLTIKGLTVSSALEVHFSNNAEKEAIVMSATKSGSDIITEIPNVLLEKDKDITAWVYTDDGHSGETIRTIILKVTPRIKPADYISENNAGKVIDYVAKAEEYANSAQESAESAQANAEQVQANTDLVQDILANVPDFDSYAKLAEHNKLLYDGLYVQGETYSGIASNKGMKLHKVVGKTQQDTTNGYQLFDASQLQTKSQGGATVTNNDDSSFTISGSGNLTQDMFYKYELTHEETIQMIKAGTLTLETLQTSYPYITVTLLNNEAGTAWYVELNNLSNNKVQASITDEMLNDEFSRLRFSFYGKNGQAIKTGTIKPMLYQDGDGTWEPYTGGKPGPNPDGVALPIKNVEITNIESRTKNLFVLLSNNLSNKDGITGIIQSDGSLIINGTPSKQYAIVYNTSITLPKGRYYISGGEYGYLYTQVTVYKGENIFFHTNKAFDIDDNVTSIILTIQTGSKLDAINNYVIYPMINIGDTKEEFEAYQGATIETSLILAEGEVYEENKPIIRKRAKVVFDGSSDENITKRNDGDGSTTISFNLNIYSALQKECICNRFIYDENSTNGVEGIGSDSRNGQLYIEIKRSRLETVDESGFKTWLQSNPLEVEYELATPVEEQITIPTIPSYSPHTNVWTDNTLSTDIEWELLANSDNSLYQEQLEKRIQALEAQILGL